VTTGFSILAPSTVVPSGIPMVAMDGKMSRIDAFINRSIASAPSTIASRITGWIPITRRSLDRASSPCGSA
jgi:hypothetical protein